MYGYCGAISRFRWGLGEDGAAKSLFLMTAAGIVRQTGQSSETSPAKPSPTLISPCFGFGLVKN
jgi:hypothetical protein